MFWVSFIRECRFNRDHSGNIGGNRFIEIDRRGIFPFPIFNVLPWEFQHHFWILGDRVSACALNLQPKVDIKKLFVHRIFDVSEHYGCSKKNTYTDLGFSVILRVIELARA